MEWRKGRLISLAELVRNFAGTHPYRVDEAWRYRDCDWQPDASGIRPTDEPPDYLAPGNDAPPLLRIQQKAKLMPLTGLAVDDSPHNKDGLMLHAQDGDQAITAFISRRVMDEWAYTKRSEPQQASFFREQYNALGRHNLPAIERIVQTKYQRGFAFNRQHPFVDVLLADIAESGEMLDMSWKATASS